MTHTTFGESGWERERRAWRERFERVLVDDGDDGDDGDEAPDRVASIASAGGSFRVDKPGGPPG